MKTGISSWLLAAGLAACANDAGGGGGAGGAGSTTSTTTPPASNGSMSGDQGGGTTIPGGSGGNGVGGAFDEDGPDPMCDGQGGALPATACTIYRDQYCDVKEALGCRINGGLAFPCEQYDHTCPIARDALFACQQAATTEPRCRCYAQGEGGDIYNGAMDCDEDVACQEAADLAACQSDPDHPDAGPFIPPESCELVGMIVIPSDLSPTDGCEARYSCEQDVDLDIECDGENDGTGTSLCSCGIGIRHFNLDPVDGEGEEACTAGYEACIALDFEALDP